MLIKVRLVSRAFSTTTALLLKVWGGIIMTDKLKEKVDLEKEWILLMKEAYEMGLSTNEVKKFVQESKRN